jgi:hypothetical protein
MLKYDKAEGLAPREALGYGAAGDSFYIIAVTFVVSRALLLLQYLVGKYSIVYECVVC